MAMSSLDTACPALMAQLRPFSAWAPLSSALSISSLPAKRVDGRKWLQVQQFVQAVCNQAPHQVTHWIDWCSGKGYLGRTLHQQLGQPVTCLEKNPSLVAVGEAEVAKASRDASNVAVSFVAQDVLDHSPIVQMDSSTGVVALHACGNLNIRLLQLAAKHQPSFLAVVPCCYQRIDGTWFTPLSKAGQNTGLGFTRHQLRIPAFDEVSVSEQKRKLRKRDMAYRQGVDLLLRNITGNNAYTPLGKIPRHLVRGSFKEFAQHAIEKMGHTIPPQISWSHAETAAWQRQHLVSALGITRQLFRRALESWLFLDRICFLEEHGYTVTAGTFCSRETTPRNLMLMAHR